MKKRVLGLLCLAAAVALAISCRKSTISSNELPEASKDFITNYFPGINVGTVKKEGKGYSVDLLNGCELEFDSTGEWLEVDGRYGTEIPTGFIHPKIVSYVGTAHVGNGINAIERNYHGFDVDLVKQDIDLCFDKEGVYLVKNH